MTSLHIEPDEKILRDGSSHHTENIIPHPHHSHHHHHHHHHHQHKSHHHHHHNNGHHHHSNGHHHHRHHHHQSHHSHHDKHAAKPEAISTVDVDEFFENSIPDDANHERIDPDDDALKVSFPIPLTKPQCNESSSGLSKSLPPDYPKHFAFPSDAPHLETSKEVSKIAEEEEKYLLTHLVMEDKNTARGVRTQRRTVSMNEDVIQKNFKKPLEELHHMKTYKENSLAAAKPMPKLIIPTAIPPRTRRLSRTKCKSPDSPCPTKEEEFVKTIEKYINSCNSNYEEVEKQINATFSTLSASLNHRRKTLIEEAKQIRDRKVKSLNEKKKNCDTGEMSRSSTITDISRLVDSNDMECETPVSEVQPNTLVDDNGIHEPWYNSVNSYTFQDYPSSEQGDSSSSNSSENANVNLNGKHSSSQEYHNGVNLDHSTEASASSSGYSTCSPTDFNSSATINGNPLHPNFTPIADLEEGNMTFSYNTDEDMNFISNIGALKEDLSSPKFTLTKGLTDSFGITGDKVEFEVQTKDKSGEPNYNPADRIVIRVFDCNRTKVNVQEEVELREKSSTDNVYRYSFIPLKPGNHEIAIKLNDIHIFSSPHKFLAFPRLNLTFTSPNTSFNDSGDHHFPISRSRKYSQNSQGSSSAEDEDDNEDEEDECHPHSMNGSDSWVIQKDGKSSLLQALCNHPSDIYANESVNGMCGWQVRITTACMHIKLNIGVKTKSGIPDLDEEFTCNFHLESFAQTSSSLDRANHVFHHGNHRGTRRKSSIFTRLSWTFTILLNAGRLRITCHELNQDKNVVISLRGKFPLLPYCSMIHHHNDDAIPHICPRPQLTFL